MAEGTEDAEEAALQKRIRQLQDDLDAARQEYEAQQGVFGKRKEQRLRDQAEALAARVAEEHAGFQQAQQRLADLQAKHVEMEQLERQLEHEMFQLQRDQAVEQIVAKRAELDALEQSRRQADSVLMREQVFLDTVRESLGVIDASNNELLHQALAHADALRDYLQQDAHGLADEFATLAVDETADAEDRRKTLLAQLLAERETVFQAQEQQRAERIALLKQRQEEQRQQQLAFAQQAKQRRDKAAADAEAERAELLAVDPDAQQAATAAESDEAGGSSGAAASVLQQKPASTAPSEVKQWVETMLSDTQQRLHRLRSSLGSNRDEEWRYTGQWSIDSCVPSQVPVYRWIRWQIIEPAVLLGVDAHIDQRAALTMSSAQQRLAAWHGQDQRMNSVRMVGPMHDIETCVLDEVVHEEVTAIVADELETHALLEQQVMAVLLAGLDNEPAQLTSTLAQMQRARAMRAEVTGEVLSVAEDASPLDGYAPGLRDGCTAWVHTQTIRLPGDANAREEDAASSAKAKKGKKNKAKAKAEVEMQDDDEEDDEVVVVDIFASLGVRRHRDILPESVTMERSYWDGIVVVQSDLDLAQQVIRKKETITSVVAAPNHAYLAIVLSDGAIVVLDARHPLLLPPSAEPVNDPRMRLILRRLPGRGETPLSVAWSATSCQLVVTDRTGVHVWSLSHADLLGANAFLAAPAPPKVTSKVLKTEQGYDTTKASLSWSVSSFPSVDEADTAAAASAGKKERERLRELRMPSQTLFHPSVTLFGQSPSVLVALRGGDVIKCNSADAAHVVVYPGLPGAAAKSVASAAGQDTRHIAQETLKWHQEPVVHLGFMGHSDSIVSMDAAGYLAIWAYDAAYLTQYGWLEPKQRVRIRPRDQTFVPIGAPTVEYSEVAGADRWAWDNAKKLTKDLEKERKQRRALDRAGQSKKRRPPREFVLAMERRARAAKRAQRLGLVPAEAWVSTTNEIGDVERYFLPSNLITSNDGVVEMHVTTYDKDSGQMIRIRTQNVSPHVVLGKLVGVRGLAGGLHLLLQYVFPAKPPRTAMLIYVVFSLQACALVPPRIELPLSVSPDDRGFLPPVFAVSSVSQRLGTDYLFTIVEGSLHVFSLATAQRVLGPRSLVKDPSRTPFTSLDVAGLSVVVAVSPVLSDPLVMRLNDRNSLAWRRDWSHTYPRPPHRIAAVPYDLRLFDQPGWITHQPKAQQVAQVVDEIVQRACEGGLVAQLF